MQCDTLDSGDLERVTMTEVESPLSPPSALSQRKKPAVPRSEERDGLQARDGGPLVLPVMPEKPHPELSQGQRLQQD